MGSTLQIREKYDTHTHNQNTGREVMLYAKSVNGIRLGAIHKLMGNSLTS
jgi:hypothetical protein